MLAYFLNISGWLLLPFMDGIAKYLSSEMHFIQIIWGRYFFMILVSFPLALIFFRKEIKFPKNISVQLFRDFLFLSTVFLLCNFNYIFGSSFNSCFCFSNNSNNFINILFKRKSWYSSLVCSYHWFYWCFNNHKTRIFEINFASISAIGAGTAYAFYIIYTRKLSFIDSPIVTLLFTGVVGCILISIILPFYWTNLDMRQLLLLILLASIGSLGHFLIILSLRLGEASKLAPLGYFEISTNILVGYMFFGDLPDIWIYLGLSLIVFSGIYIFIRENKKT